MTKDTRQALIDAALDPISRQRFGQPPDRAVAMTVGSDPAANFRLFSGIAAPGAALGRGTKTGFGGSGCLPDRIAAGAGFAKPAQFGRVRALALVTASMLSVRRGTLPLSAPLRDGPAPTVHAHVHAHSAPGIGEAQKRIPRKAGQIAARYAPSRPVRQMGGAGRRATMPVPVPACPQIAPKERP